MNATKILTEEISDLTVASLPTRPTASVSLGGRGYSSTEMKEAFDKLPLFIIERFNALLDDIGALGAESLSGAIKTGLSDGHSLYNLFTDIANGSFASYMTVLEKSLTVHLAEIYERLSLLEEGMK